MKIALLSLLFSLGVLTACGEAQATATPIPTAQTALLEPGNAGRGQALFQQPLIGAGTAPGCANCHSLSANVRLVGPSLVGVAQRAQTVIAQATYQGEAQNGAAYLRESILDPALYLADGFAVDAMYGAYANELSPQEVEDLVAFLLTLD
jgi:cytochrome c2